MPTCRFTSGFLAASVLLAGRGAAQISHCQAGWLPGLGAPPGTDKYVGAETVFDDGTGPALFVGGMFSEAGGIPASRVARWDGSHWGSLGSGIVAGPVLVLATLDDGSGRALYAGGFFSAAGGVAARNIARWNGSQWSALGTGQEFLGAGHVAALAAFDDGTGPAIYAGGSFYRWGLPATGILRWDGSHWSDVGAMVDTYVSSLVVHDDGTGAALYAGGSFPTAGGVSIQSIARWDGTTWSQLGSGMTSGFVAALASFDDGGGPALFAGGDFVLGGTSQATNLAKWSGGSWTRIETGMFVSALAAYDDGSGPALYAAGHSTPSSGVSGSQRIAKWDGATWRSLNTELVGDLSELAVFDDASGARLYVGGSLTRAGDLPVRGIASWDGSAWAGLGSPPEGPDSMVFAQATFDDGHGRALYVGGASHSFGSLWTDGLARWDGTRWSQVGLGLDGPSTTVSALEVHDDGNGPALYASGDFTGAGGVPASRIARWDGTNWSPLGAGLSFQAACMRSFDGGSGPALYVAASLMLPGAAGIVRWDGSQWGGVAGGLWRGQISGYAYAMQVFDDGAGPALYVGGWFDHAGSVPAMDIARWDGSTWSAVGAGLPGEHVYALCVFDDGSGPALYAGGRAGVGVSRWDGTQWTQIGDFYNWTVNALAVHDDGGGRALYAAGDFNGVNGASARHIARWDGSAWSTMGAGLSRPVWSLATFDDGTCTGPALYVGAAWIDSAIDPNQLARWGCAAECTLGFCFGDGSSATQAACPCANTGVAGRGCENSAATGGAQLRASGDAFNDTLALTSSGELTSSISTFLQGNAQIANGVVFGDGVRCVAGSLKRLYVKSAIGGVVSAPVAGDPSIRQQSANLGDPIAPGTRRWYQVYYRDPNTSFCPAPQGGTFNASNGIEVRW